MPKIFISYSHHNIDTAKLIVSRLKDKGFIIWRDGESIRIGEAWPRAIGEGIADNDYVLLFWSKEASASETIELEWTTCIALKKPILPVFLDGTPLPAILRAKHAITYDNPDNLVERIVERLSKLQPATDNELQTDVLNALSDIRSEQGKEAQTVAEARQAFQERGWLPARTTKMVWSLLALILISVTAYFIWIPPPPPLLPETSQLTGIVQDANGSVLQNALVKVVEKPGDSVLTTMRGEFRIAEIKGKNGDSVRISIRRTGYKPIDMYTPLPGPNIFVLPTISMFTKAIRIKPKPNPLDSYGHLVKESIRFLDRTGREVASLPSWEGKNTVTLPEGSYDIVIYLQFRTQSGYSVKCSTTRTISFINGDPEIVSVACFAQ